MNGATPPTNRNAIALSDARPTSSWLRGNRSPGLSPGRVGTVRQNCHGRNPRCCVWQRSRATEIHGLIVVGAQEHRARRRGIADDERSVFEASWRPCPAESEGTERPDTEGDASLVERKNQSERDIAVGAVSKL